MGQGVQMRVMAAFIYSFMMTVSVLATAVYTHNHCVSNYDCKLSHSQTHSLDSQSRNETSTFSSVGAILPDFPHLPKL